MQSFYSTTKERRCVMACMTDQLQNDPKEDAALHNLPSPHFKAQEALPRLPFPVKFCRTLLLGTHPTGESLLDALLEYCVEVDEATQKELLRKDFPVDRPGQCLHLYCTRVRHLGLGEDAVSLLSAYTHLAHHGCMCPLEAGPALCLRSRCDNVLMPLNQTGDSYELNAREGICTFRFFRGDVQQTLSPDQLLVFSVAHT